MTPRPAHKGDLKSFLNQKVQLFNTADFIPNDPISIPHQYTKLQDIEITGFWTAMLSWGQRKTIINKATSLFQLMDNAPYDFIVNHEEKDRAKLLSFKHRTFQPLDTLYFLAFFQQYYKKHHSLEEAFAKHIDKDSEHIGAALSGFHQTFFDLENAPQRTRKHVATPDRKSTCKRLNMFLRWMVRTDEAGVDFGLWNSIDPSQLLIPYDVHVDRIARRFNLVDRKQKDWKTVLELSSNLKEMCPEDPIKYDYALFGIGVLEKSF